MTDENMALLALIQKSDDGDFLKSVAEAALQRIMDFDVENLIGAAPHERSAERLTYRNGYRERTLGPKITAALNQDIQDLATVGVSQTPTFFVNGKRLQEFGVQPFQDLVRGEVAAAR